MSDDPYQSIAFCLMLILCEAMTTASEISTFSVSENCLQQLVAEGRTAAKRVQTLQNSEAQKTQQLIQYARILLHLLLGASALTAWVPPLLTIMPHSLPMSLATFLAILLVFLPTAILVFVLGRLLPRRWALQDPEKIALLLVAPLDALLALLRPLYPIWHLLFRTAIKISGDRSSDPVDEVTEEEIKAFVAEHGSIAEEEKDMIHSVFEFGDISVGELMVPRIDIEALEESSSIEDALQLFHESGYSRLPIYQGTIDHITGIVNLKDVLNAWLHKKDAENVRSCKREVYVVPEQKMALELLHEMQRKRQQMAIVTDEFGGTAGLITVEDLVEQIVGEIRDETDNDEQDEISIISPRKEARVLGMTLVHSLNDELGWKLPETEDYDTVGGLAFSLLGRIPQVGEQVECEEYLLTVEKMDRRRIEQLHIIRRA